MQIIFMQQGLQAAPFLADGFCRIGHVYLEPLFFGYVLLRIALR
jgi:hypothetical protein